MPTPLLPQTAAPRAAALAVRDLLAPGARGGSPSDSGADDFAAALERATVRRSPERDPRGEVCRPEAREPRRPEQRATDRTADHSDRADRADRADRTDRTDRGDRTDRTDLADRTDRTDRTDRGDRTDHADHADHADRGDRADRADRTDGADGRSEDTVDDTSGAADVASEDTATDAVPAVALPPTVPSTDETVGSTTDSGTPSEAGTSGTGTADNAAQQSRQVTTTSGEAAVTGSLTGDTAPVPAGDRAPDARDTNPLGGAPEGTAEDGASRPVAEGGPATQDGAPGGADQQRREHSDQGRHLGQRAETGQPLVVGRDLGAASGRHLGTEHTRTPEVQAPTVTGLVTTSTTTATTTATGMTSTATAGPAGAAAVPEQVFTSLSRLVSRGGGTHRLTIKLQPEALGEVRVVLTVRDGDVTVRLAGSEVAQRALLQGAGDLQRLLESAGARNASVVVGDPGGQPGQLPTHGNGAGWGQQSRGDRGAHVPAYPGSGATPATQTTPTRTRTGTSGLDVTV